MQGFFIPLLLLLTLYLKFENLHSSAKIYSVIYTIGWDGWVSLNFYIYFCVCWIRSVKDLGIYFIEKILIFVITVFPKTHSSFSLPLFAMCIYIYTQARNQEFVRAGEVSRNRDSSINVSYTTYYLLCKILERFLLTWYYLGDSIYW